MGERLIIRNGTVIDGTGNEPIHDAVIILEGTRISRVGRAADFGADQLAGATTRTIDATGKYVIPGLINLHEHLDNHRGVGSFQERAAQPIEWLILRAARNALISLARGVTTVRDAGSKGATNIVIRDAINSGQILGPRVFASGQMIAMTGGHASEIALEADGPDNVRAATRKMLKIGADVIKLMCSGGYVTHGRDLPWSPQFTLEEISAAVDEAHRAGKTVMAHCHPPEAIKSAVKAGVDTIEHGGLMDRESAELLERTGTYLIPTLDESWMIAERGHELGRPQWLIDACKQKLEHRLEIFRYAVEAGVKLGVGTDVAGEMGRELKHMIDGGLKPMQALVAATRNGAEVLRLADQLGTIEAGKLADIVILDDNPLEDPLTCDRPHLVIKGGVVHDPAQLLAALGPTPS